MSSKLRVVTQSTFLFTAMMIGLGCSLGTEVGNGLKPSKKDGGGIAPASSENKSAPFRSVDDSLDPWVDSVFDGDEMAETNSGMPYGSGASAGGYVGAGVSGTGSLGTDIGTAVGGSGTYQTTTEGLASRDVETSIKSANTKDSAAQVLQIDLAFTGCASPLYGKPVSGSAKFKFLVGGNAQGTVTIDANQDGKSWSLAASSPAVARILDVSTTTVRVTDPKNGGAPVSSYATCGQVLRTRLPALDGYSGTFEKNTVILYTSLGRTYLTWYVKEGAEGYMSRLKRVELSRADSTTSGAYIRFDAE